MPKKGKVPPQLRPYLFKKGKKKRTRRRKASEGWHVHKR